jgi:hypothetical protein
LRDPDDHELPEEDELRPPDQELELREDEEDEDREPLLLEPL